MAYMRRFVVMSDAQLCVVALWVMHTHIVDSFEQTPYLAITSPERECGKSRLMEVLELLVADPWMITMPSEAVIFRKVHAVMPTLLWDEIDTVFNPKSAQHHEDKRALLDQGHRRHGRVPRFIGEKVVEFNVYCPKALAGIGTLPDTIAGRSIPIRLQRRAPNEQIDRFIARDERERSDALVARLAARLEPHERSIADARPRMPEQLSDRMQEGCEPLIAIADRLGAGAEARAALVELLTGERVDAQESLRERLLRDIKAVFEARERRALRTPVLLGALYALEEAPWSSYYGRGLEPRDLSALLRPYGVRPKTIKFKTGEAHKGYRRDDLHEAWARYLR